MPHKDPFTLRVAATADTKSVSALSAMAWLDTYSPEGVNDLVASYVEEALSPEIMQNRILEDRTFVAEHDDYLLGLIVIGPPNASRQVEIERLYVHRHHKRRGIGYELVGMAIEAARSQAANTVWLSCWVENEEAISFYQKNSFEIIRETVFHLGEHANKNFVFSRRI